VTGGAVLQYRGIAHSLKDAARNAMTESLRHRSKQHFAIDRFGVISETLIPNSTAEYLWTIVGRNSQVSVADFARELYGDDCLDPRHARDWLNFRTRPHAASAWKIGEALHRVGVRHASGLLMLLAAGRLSDFAATIVGLDPMVVAQHSDHLAYLLESGMSAVRGILLDNTALGRRGLLGGDEDMSDMLKAEIWERPRQQYAPYIDMEVETENHRKRAAARAVWNVQSDVRAAANESFHHWRSRKSQPRINECRAACAMAIADEVRMTAFDREEMVIEALLCWLREKVLGPIQPPKPWLLHVIEEG